MQASTFNYPEGSHQLKEMEDDASFLTSSYVVRKFYSFPKICPVKSLQCAGFLEAKQGPW
jgi:hypothetical protein